MRNTLSFIGLLLIFSGCARKLAVPVPPPVPAGANRFPQYSDIRLWAAHPWVKDLSDSLPEPLKGEVNDSIADVFFIHPTTYVGIRTGWNAKIEDADLNIKTDKSTILYQASVFNQHCRVFAPRYRQAHLSAFFITNEETAAAFDTAYADVRNAFLYYMQYHNHARPVIIAGHSQGALLSLRLLKEFFEGKPLQDGLVAAYIIGWPVAVNYFSGIPACKDSLQTGCFCTWRTFRKGYMPAYVQDEKFAAVVTNPLTWTIDETYADRSLNKGAVLQNFSKLVKNTTDAQVYKNVLWVTRPKFWGSVLLTTKNYHIADINFYYMNLRVNIEQRIHSFQGKK